MEILERRRERQTDEIKLEQVTTPKEIQKIRQKIEEVFVAPEVEKYIVTLVAETRKNSQVAVGASPRGSLALLKLTRARAALSGRDFVLPDDVKELATPALVHRLILKPDLWLQTDAAYSIIHDLVSNTPVPVVKEKEK